VVALAGTVMQGADFPLWTFIWDHYLQIFTANLVISFVLACFVYARSFQVRAGNAEKRELAPGGHSGNIMYDWFIGRELNPRVTLPVFGTIDIKTFCEVRPGLLGWFMLDAAFMAHQYKVHGYLTDSMIMTVTFQGLYVFDALWMEPSILTQIDITSDGFGFMLAFGDLAWLPFLYSLQARYLAVHPVRLGVAGVAGILVFQGLGYYIFRSSNNEKDRFRKNPQDPRVSHLRYIETPSGGKLITSGWWGTARHINYCGDLIMAWSYCLPTAVAGYLVRPSPNAPMDGAQAPTGGAYGGGSPATTRVVPGEARGWGMVITYFYVVYFAVLLIHRERRDELKCRRKYGPTWDEYKRLVPWRIIPWVY
jgi:delta14-sterol reductase